MHIKFRNKDLNCQLLMCQTLASSIRDFQIVPNSAACSIYLPTVSTDNTQDQITWLFEIPSSRRQDTYVTSRYLVFGV